MAYQPESGDSDDETRRSTNDSQDTTPLAGTGFLPVSGTLTNTVGLGPGDASLGGGGAGAPLLGGAAFYGAVIPGQASDGDNGALADRAEMALAEDGRLSVAILSAIHVSATNNTVILTGTAPTHAEAEIAARICAEVSGAASVDNQLTVS